MAGKGSKTRVTSPSNYRDGWDHYHKKDKARAKKEAKAPVKPKKK